MLREPAGRVAPVVREVALRTTSAAGKPALLEVDLASIAQVCVKALAAESLQAAVGPVASKEAGVGSHRRQLSMCTLAITANAARATAIRAAQTLNVVRATAVPVFVLTYLIARRTESGARQERSVALAIAAQTTSARHLPRVQS